MMGWLPLFPVDNVTVEFREHALIRKNTRRHLPARKIFERELPFNVLQNITAE
jgi:hypothetical protein